MEQKKIVQKKVCPSTLPLSGGGAALRRAACALLCALLCVPAALRAQDLNISGTVLDERSAPLAGVSVVVKGSTRGATTGVSGDYNIQAPADATLVFSFMGMATREEPINGRGRIDVILSEDDKALEEVVVIGYGVQRREAVTGSVASMGGQELAQVASGNITQALQGRIAGVEMSQTNSKPGSTMQIRIRGTRSLNASNDPLVVLDGIPFAGSIGDINPGDIKSIDILKDASATAIYGARGANGVILVTTHKGTVGQKATVSYNGYVGTKNIFSPYPMMDGPELIALREASGKYPSLGADEDAGINTSWQDLFYRTGIVNSHDVGISGGTTTGTYNFGIAYYKEEGVIPTQDYSRISLRGTLDQQVGKYFRFGVTTNNSYNTTNGSQIGMYGVLNSSPLASPYNDDGTIKAVFAMPSDMQYTLTREVVEDLEANDKWVSQGKGFGSYNNVFGEVKIPGVEGLKYRANLGLNFRMAETGAYTGIGVNNSTPTNPSSASLSHSITTNWAMENLLTYDRTFADKHQVNVVGLFSAEQTHYHYASLSGINVPADFLQYYNFGQVPTENININPNDQDYQLSALTSWMGRAMYSYDGRYMLSVAFRSDASSRLAPGHQRHTYPAVSAGWNISEEEFLKGVPAIDKLKLRVGYGETSNQSINPYATLGELSTRFYNFGPTNFQTGYYVSSLPNPNLGWEYSETWNFGVDFTLLKNRLTGTVEYYVQNTKDVLLGLSLPRTSGVSGSYYANIGQTQNKGVEFSLNGVILDNLNGFTWEAGVNFYANRNKLVALASGQERDEGNWWFVGYPIDVIYDYEYDGLWQEGDPYLAELEPGGNVGMIKVKHTLRYDGEGKLKPIGADDRQIISMEPNFQGGFNTRLEWKGLELGLVGAFKNGGKLISTLYSTRGYLNQLTGRRNQVSVDYWTPQNTGAKYPKPGGMEGAAEGPKYGDSLGYFDASYVKIRTITLGYSIGRKWTTAIGVDRLRLYATVQNPFVMFSPYHSETGLDPEPNSYGDENLASNNYNSRLLIVGTNAPATRSYLFGINLTF